MRLNWFIPRSGSTKSKPLRGNGLKILGPAGAASPIRRLIQGLALTSFLWLFFSEYLVESDWLAGVAAWGLEALLKLDPLASISAAIGARTLTSSLLWAGGALAVCLIVPRWFCGYLCPLGTMLDVLDWALGRRAARVVPAERRWWMNLRYYLLAAMIALAVLGVGIPGLLASIPLLTRGMLLVVRAFQGELLSGSTALPPLTASHYLAMGLLAGVFALAFLGRRFWCRYVCPTGAVFSLAGFAGLTSRSVTSQCTECGQCAASCAFGAIGPDFSTRRLDCSFCQVCGGLCPAGAIQFTGRRPKTPAKPSADDARSGARYSRRRFLASAGGLLVVLVGLRSVLKAAAGFARQAIIRPPGSVPEDQFLLQCVRCEQCMKVCPTNMLQPTTLEGGVEGVWSPQAATDIGDCRKNCNKCGQVCPTGAIRDLPLEEKQAARMGLAVIDEETCLPHAGTKQCDFCVRHCPYEAMEYVWVGVELDEDGMPIQNTGFQAPVVLEDKCVGCGACQAACYRLNVRKSVLAASAICIHAGDGKDDRITSGSYLQLRRDQSQARIREIPQSSGDGYLPDFLE